MVSFVEMGFADAKTEVSRVHWFWGCPIRREVISSMLAAA